jgi:hypothetical protein
MDDDAGLLVVQRATDDFLENWYSAAQQLAGTPRTNGRGALVDETSLLGRLREAELAIERARDAIKTFRSAVQRYPRIFDTED